MQRLTSRFFLAAALVMAPLDAQAADLVRLVGEGVLPPGGRGDQRSSSPPSSTRPARRSSSSNHPHVGHPESGPSGARCRATSRFLVGWRNHRAIAEAVGLRGSARGSRQRPSGFCGSLFDHDLLERATLLNERTGGRRALYALPMGFAIPTMFTSGKTFWSGPGFTLADIPKEWDAFWSFWCDRVQPAVRKALGRDDIYGVALPMSMQASDTQDALDQFLWAYTPHSLPPARQAGPRRLRRSRAILVQGAGQLHSDLQERLHAARCRGLDATGRQQQSAFLEQRVVMVPNPSLSIPNMLRQDRPDDYYRNAATIDWPRDTFGEPLVITTGGAAACRVQRRRQQRHGQRVRALPGGGRLARALSRLFARPVAAADAQADRPAVLARPERSAPHALGDADPDAARRATAGGAFTAMMSGVSIWPSRRL